MGAARVLAAAALMLVLTSVVSAAVDSSVSSPVDLEDKQAHHRNPFVVLVDYFAKNAGSLRTEPHYKQSDRGDKKTNKLVSDMFKAFMIVKNVIGFLLMFVSPIMQVKGFGLQVINTIVNIARFFLMVQNSQSSHHQIHLTQQPYSYDVQNTHQSYGHDVHTGHQQYAHDVQPLHSQTYSQDYSQTYSSDYQPAQVQSYSTDIQPAHLQSYSHETQPNSQYGALTRNGVHRRHYSPLPTSMKNTHIYRKPSSTKFS